MTEAVIEKRNNLWLIIDRYFLETPPSVKEENQNYFVFLSSGTIFGLSAHVSYLFIFWFFGVKQLALFNIISVSAWLTAVILNRKGHHIISMTICILEICIHQTLCIIFIGWESGFQYYILLIPMTIYLAPSGFNFIKLVLILVCFLNIALLDYFYKVSEPLFVLNPLILAILNYGNIFIVVSLMS
jgi:hypothetical protein